MPRALFTAKARGLTVHAVMLLAMMSTLRQEIMAETIAVVDLRATAYEARKPLQKRLHDSLQEQDFNTAHRDTQDLLLSIPDPLVVARGLQVLKSPARCKLSTSSLSTLVSAMTLKPSLKEETLKRLRFYEQCARDRGEHSKSSLFSTLIVNATSEDSSSQHVVSPTIQLDAVSNRPLFSLSLETPFHGELFIDLKRTAPNLQKQHLPAGLHVLTSHNAVFSESKLIDLQKDDSPTFTHSFADETSLVLLKQVDTWKTNNSLIEPMQVGTFFQHIDSDGLVFIHPNDAFSLWQSNLEDGDVSRLIGTNMNEEELARELDAHFITTVDAPNKDELLAYESPMNNDESELKWWILGGAVSAAIVTTIVVLGTRRPSQTQTIEVDIP